MSTKKYIYIKKDLPDGNFLEFEYFYDLETYMYKLDYTYLPRWLHSDKYPIKRSFIQYNSNIELSEITTDILLRSKVNKLVLTNYSREKICLPQNIKHLYFYYYNKPINNLPEHITHLTILRSFNEPILRLPKDLIYLYLGDNYDQELDCLPENLQILKLGNDYDKPLDNLPSFLQELYIQGIYNHPLDNLPNRLEFLETGEFFNKELDFLPCSLIVLKLGKNFNQKLDNLPDSIKYLYLGENFNQKITKLPSNLEILEIDPFSRMRCKQNYNFTNIKLLVPKKLVDNNIIKLNNLIEYNDGTTPYSA